MKKAVLALLVGTTFLLAADGASAYKSCVICHGAKGEKKALGKSDAIDTWSAAQIEEALKGYKSGTRDIHGMAGAMKGPMATMDEATIKAVSEYIAGMK
jgi:cytochrome c